MSKTGKCLVQFQPQQWIFDQATESEHPFDIDVTDRVVALGREAALKVVDCSDGSDALVSDRHKHRGPFAVYCEAQIRGFFTEGK